MDEKILDFTALLVKRTDEKDLKADALANIIYKQFSHISDLNDKAQMQSAINNWLRGRVNKPRKNQWKLLVAIAAVLDLSEEALDKLLNAAGQDKWQDLLAKTEHKELFTLWTTPTPTKMLEQNLQALQTGQENIHRIQERLLQNSDHHSFLLTDIQDATAQKPPKINLTDAEIHYRKQLVDTYKIFDFSGFEQADISQKHTPLEKIFVHLALSMQKRDNQGTLHGTEEEQEQSDVGAFINYKPISLGQALSNHLLLTGEPGGGKSILLKWLAVTFAQGKQQLADYIGPSADADRLPILIELKELPQTGRRLSLLSLIPSYIAKQDTFVQTPPQLLEQALRAGRCLLLFDGLDEVADLSTRLRLTQSLKALARQPLGNRIVVSSRLAGLSESEAALYPFFQRCKLERLTLSDIQNFFLSWYKLDENLSHEQQLMQVQMLLRKIQDEPRLFQLAQTPLFCTMLLLLWRKDNSSLPQQRSALYERCCRAILQQWEQNHTITSKDNDFSLTTEQHLRLLAPIAYILHENEQREYGQPEQQKRGNRDIIIQRLTEHLADFGFITAFDQEKAERLIDILGNRSGLFQYQGKDKEGQAYYGFTHLTFQEYLAARFLEAQPDDQLIDYIVIHLHEAWWQNVYLLTVGILESRQNNTTRLNFLLSIILHQYSLPTWTTRRAVAGRVAYYPVLEIYLNWLLGRSVRFCIQACAECANPTLIWESHTGQILLKQIEKLTKEILAGYQRPRVQHTLLILLITPLLEFRKESISSILLNVLCSSSTNADAVAECLGEIALSGNRVAIEILHKALQSLTDIAPRGIVEALGKAVQGGDQQSLHMLARVLQSPDALVQSTALKSIEGAAKADFQPALQILLSAAQNSSKIQMQAIFHLGFVAGIGNQQAQDVLLQLAQHPNAVIRQSVFSSFKNAANSNNSLITQVLFQGLNDDQKETRQAAAICLIELAIENNEQALNALLEALRTANKKAHLTIIDGLAYPGTHGSGEVLGKLFRGLQDAQDEQILQIFLKRITGYANNFFRATTISWLTPLATQGNQQALNTLFVAARYSTSYIRSFAINGLGLVAGVGNQQALQHLLQVAQRKNQEGYVSAIGSLGPVAATGNQQALDLIFQAMQDSDNEIRKAAIHSLRPVTIGGNQQALDILCQSLQSDPDSSTRLIIVSILEHLAKDGNEQAFQSLLQDTQDPSGLVRENVFMSLLRVGAIGNQRAIDALFSAFEDSDPYVRYEVITHIDEIANINEEKAIDMLLLGLHDNDFQVFKSAVKRCRNFQIASQEQFRQILSELAYYSCYREGTVYMQAIDSLQILLDGQGLPSNGQWLLSQTSSPHKVNPKGRMFPTLQWTPLQQQREQRRRWKRSGYSLLFLVLMLTGGCMCVFKFAHPVLAVGWLILLSILLICLLGVALLYLNWGRSYPGDR